MITILIILVVAGIILLVILWRVWKFNSVWKNGLFTKNVECGDTKDFPYNKDDKESMKFNKFLDEEEKRLNMEKK